MSEMFNQHNVVLKSSKANLIWHGLFLVAAILYCEILLHLLIGAPSNLRTYGYLILFSVAFGALLSLVSLLPWGRGINCIILAALFVLFCVQYFLYQSFQTFMNLTALTTAAADVAGEFTSTLLLMILKGWWVILLFALPFLVYLIFGKKLFCPTTRSKFSALCYALVFLLFFSLGLLAIHTNQADLAKYKKKYEFSAACQHFGLLTGCRIDLQYMLFGNNSATELAVVEVPVEAVPAPDVALSEDTENQPEESEPKPQYGYNSMDIDFSAINETVGFDALIAMNNYISDQTASRQNEYTGLLAGKNLIFITAEAFSAELIDPQLTPTLYRMATKGIDFTEYYQPAWGGSTSTGEYSNLTGLIPVDGVSSIQRTQELNMYFTLGNQLQRLGYFSAAYHNNDYTYYNRHLTHENLGYSTFVGMGNGMEDGVTDLWPQSDLEMVRHTLPDYLQQQPFSIYYMSVSGHGTYQQGANAMTQKNWDAVAALDASDTIKGYYAANLELEYAMEYLIAQLESAGIASETVIVIAADHYPYALEASDTWGNHTSYLPELYGYPADNNIARDHNDLIIWSGCLEDMALQVDTPVYSLDIVPTLSNLFGLTYDSRLLVGRDVFSDQIPLVIWRDYSWKTDYGYYNAVTGLFTPDEGVNVPDGYVETVQALVQNKYALSNLVLDHDYYGLLFGPDETNG